MTPYRFTALTPLLVGDGYRLSPIDYMVWKDQVNVLDQTRIFRLLSKGPRLESYLAQLRKAERLDFASWGGFAQNYAERRIPFEHPSLSYYWNEARPENLFIPTFTSGPAGPYLPASALKGALKTAFVFSRWNSGHIRELLNRMDGDRPVRRPGEAAESMTLSGNADLLRGSVISDSKVVAGGSFKVYLVRVATLESRGTERFATAWKVAAGRNSPRPEGSTAVFAEMAKPGAAFLGELKIGKSGRVFEAANQHAGFLLEMQRTYAEQAGLPRVRATVDALLGRLQEIGTRRDVCLLNVGWAAGFLSKAGFPNTTDEDYRKLLGRLPFYERAIRSGLPFPKTRRIVFEQDQPSTLPGWAMLELG